MGKSEGLGTGVQWVPLLTLLTARPGLPCPYLSKHGQRRPLSPLAGRTVSAVLGMPHTRHPKKHRARPNSASPWAVAALQISWLILKGTADQHRADLGCTLEWPHCVPTMVWPRGLGVGLVRATCTTGCLGHMVSGPANGNGQNHQLCP